MFVAAALVLSLIFAGWKFAWFFWVPLLPLLLVVWVLRARTTISERGIAAVYLFRSKQNVTWENFAGILFPKGGTAYAVRKDDTKFPLPGISFNDMPKLSKASEGRIPDPVTRGRKAADDAVTVFDKDGRTILVERRSESTKFDNVKSAKQAADKSAEKE